MNIFLHKYTDNDTRAMILPGWFFELRSKQYFHAPALIDRGHIVFGQSVCPSCQFVHLFVCTVNERPFIFHIYIFLGVKPFFLVSKSRSWSNIKVTVFEKKKRPLWGHSCFTNTSCF